jgi:hypothetical protein
MNLAWQRFKLGNLSLVLARSKLFPIGDIGDQGGSGDKE